MVQFLLNRMVAAGANEKAHVVCVFKQEALRVDGMQVRDRDNKCCTKLSSRSLDTSPKLPNRGLSLRDTGRDGIARRNHALKTCDVHSLFEILDNPIVYVFRCVQLCHFSIKMECRTVSKALENIKP